MKRVFTFWCLLAGFFMLFSFGPGLYGQTPGEDEIEPGDDIEVPVQGKPATDCDLNNVYETKVKVQTVRICASSENRAILKLVEEIKKGTYSACDGWAAFGCPGCVIGEGCKVALSERIPEINPIADGEGCWLFTGGCYTVKYRCTICVVQAGKHQPVRVFANLDEQRNALKNEQEWQSLQSIAPNPASQSFSLGYKVYDSFDLIQVLITDMQGRVVRDLAITEQVPGQYSKDIPIHDLQAGLYSVNLIVDGEPLGSKRLSVVR